MPAHSKNLLQSYHIDYGYTPIPDFTQWGRHRATADPVIVTYKTIIIYFLPINGAMVES